MNKMGIIGSWFRICASGFGLGVDAARAFGIVVFIITVIFVAAIAILVWLIKFIMRRNQQNKEAEQIAAQQPEQTQE